MPNFAKWISIFQLKELRMFWLVILKKKRDVKLGSNHSDFCGTLSITLWLMILWEQRVLGKYYLHMERKSASSIKGAIKYVWQTQWGYWLQLSNKYFFSKELISIIFSLRKYCQPQPAWRWMSFEVWSSVEALNLHWRKFLANWTKAAGKWGIWWAIGGNLRMLWAAINR